MRSAEPGRRQVLLQLRCAAGAVPTGRGWGGGDRPGDTTSIISPIAGEPDYGDEPSPDFSMVDSLPPGTALLVVLRGPNAGCRFLLDSDFTCTGRHPDSDIFLDDVTVSRRHAEFYRMATALPCVMLVA